MSLFRKRGAENGGGGSLRIYYASDIHGTEVLWRKFLHAPAVYDTPVIVMGGDVTGKVVIPLVEEAGRQPVGVARSAHHALSCPPLRTPTGSSLSVIPPAGSPAG